MSDENTQTAGKKTPAELLHVMQDRFLRDAASNQAEQLSAAWKALWEVLNRGIADNQKLFGLLLSLHKGDIRYINADNVLKSMTDYDKSKIIGDKTRELFGKLNGISAMAVAAGIPEDELPW